MANLIFDKVQIEATIDKIVDRTMRMDMTWDWPCGVAYYGICEAYEVTKNERYLQLVKDRVDEYIELGLPCWTVNLICFAHKHSLPPAVRYTSAGKHQHRAGHL